MKPHPFLRAYMAGITVPTVFLLVGVTAFTLVREVCRIPLPLERIIVFPMAVVPNLWGLWNVLHLALGERRWPIGVHGAALPLLLIPMGLLLAHLYGVRVITPALAAPAAPFGMAIYYLAWKYLVGYF